MAAPPRVTVVVPVYRPGAAIEPLVGSLREQTLPAEQVEAIFVDDGSGDDTPARLQEIVAGRPGWRFEPIERTGWPSRPRNVGIELARGEYVFFADQDDRLDPEALERLCDRADADGADVVVGKVVGHGKAVPRDLFRENRAGVTLEWPPLIRLLTPHKLFRRAFLDEHGIRFPEDGERLEDHVFVLQAYFHTTAVSVLADHPTYHWIRHEDGENASFQKLDPQRYYARVAQILDLVDAHTDPGPLRDAIYANYLRSKLYMRLSDRAFLTRSKAHNEDLFAAIRDLAVARFPVEVEERLGLRHRLRGRLVRAGDLDGLRALAQFERRLRARALLVERRRTEDGEGVRLRFEGRLRVWRQPLAVRLRGVRQLWEPHGPLAEALAGSEVDLAGVLPNASLALLLVSPRDGTEFTVPVRHDVRLDPLGPEGDRFTPVLIGEAVIDPRTAAAGRPLRRGRWEARLLVTLGGFTATADAWRRTYVAGDKRQPLVFTVEKGGRFPQPPPPPQTVRARVTRKVPGPARAGLRRVRGAAATARRR